MEEIWRTFYMNNIFNLGILFLIDVFLITGFEVINGKNKLLAGWIGIVGFQIFMLVLGSMIRFNIL